MDHAQLSGERCGASWSGCLDQKRTGEACPAARRLVPANRLHLLFTQKRNKVVGALENAAGRPGYKQREGRLRAVCLVRERTPTKRTVCDLNTSLLKKFGYPSGRGRRELGLQC